MDKLLICLLVLSLAGCQSFMEEKQQTDHEWEASDWNAEVCMDSQGALVGTRFESYESLKKCLRIEHSHSSRAKVQLRHNSGAQSIISILKAGVSEKDIEQAQAGTIKAKLAVVVKSPYLIICREDLTRIMSLARRKSDVFGEGDQSFFDLALMMTQNIHKTELDSNYQNDLSEKGFLNTFNHITAQALITSLFSERTADYVADLHELARIPELTSGEFSKEQIEDLSNGPVDNYVDLINNEWGQELGKELSAKYKIGRNTTWSPALLTDYLNDIQSYCSWALGLSLDPFTIDDDIVLKFSKKINLVMSKVG